MKFGGASAAELTNRLGNKADPKYGCSIFVQELDLPSAVLLHIARDAANQIAADTRHLSPCSFLVGGFEAVDMCVCIFTVAHAEEILRHDTDQYLWRLSATKQQQNFNYTLAY